MMSAELLARSGLAHMPVASGCERFLDEVMYGAKGTPEVLLFRPGAGGVDLLQKLHMSSGQADA